MKNFVKFTLILVAFALFNSCIENTKNKETEIINNCFLNIVDTFAYKYHNLRPGSEDPIFDAPGELNIAVYHNLVNLNKWKSEILSSLSELKDSSLFNEYSLVLNHYANDTLEKKLNIAEIKKIGRYTLKKYTNPYIHKQDGFIGHITFCRVAYNEDLGKAILVATIASDIKSGVVKLFLLKKHANDWKVFNEFTLEVW